MANQVSQVFATTMQKSMTWLHEIEAETGWHDGRSYRALRATLHTLRDRLTVDQAAHLGAQLPMLVRGFYYEGWHPAGAPNKDIAHKQDFLDCIRADAGDPAINPETAARVCLSVLARHITLGELRKVREQLPKDIASLLPDGADGTARPDASGVRSAKAAPAGQADFVAGPQGVRPVQH